MIGLGPSDRTATLAIPKIVGSISPNNRTICFSFVFFILQRFINDRFYAVKLKEREKHVQFLLLKIVAGFYITIYNSTR